MVGLALELSIWRQLGIQLGMEFAMVLQVGTIPVIGVAATGVAIGATIITITIIIRITSVTVGVVATGEVVMDGMAQADVTRGYMPEDIPIAIVLHAQAGIIT